MTARLPEPYYLPTPSFGINRALGGEGLASGRIHLYWGIKASGKSTSAFHQIRMAQQQGKVCAYVDSERAFTPAWAERCGVDLDSLLYIRKNAVEDILEVLLPDLQSEKIDVVIVDSLSSMNYRSFYEKAESNPMGSAARSSKFFTQKVLESLGMSQHVILISHAAMDLSGHYPQLKAAVGSAIDHWTSTQIRFQKLSGKDNVKEDGSFKVKWVIGKSKQSVYPVEGYYWFNPHTATIDNIAEVADAAIEAEIVEKSGAWIKYDGTQFHGVNKFTLELKENQELYDEIAAKVNSIGVKAMEDEDDQV